MGVALVFIYPCGKAQNTAKRQESGSKPSSAGLSTTRRCSTWQNRAVRSLEVSSSTVQPRTQDWRVGDVIVRVDGQEVTEQSDLRLVE